MKKSELGIDILEPSEDDIKDVALEMADRLEGKWKSSEYDNELQKKFWDIYLSSPYTREFSPLHKITKASRKLHGKIKVKFGSKFLRNNIEWLN